MEALLGKLLVVAGSAVDVLALGQEALRADRLLAFEALEAVLVPHLVLVLHILGSCEAQTVEIMEIFSLYKSKKMLLFYLVWFGFISPY